MKNFRFLILGIAALLCSCNAQRRVLYLQDVKDGAVVEVPDNYQIRIKPLDQLTVVVNSKNPELAVPFNSSSSYSALSGIPSSSSLTNNSLQVLTVNEEGMLNLPIIGAIKCDGMTRAELSRAIERKIIEGGYIADPNVNVRFANLTVSVLGEVNRPGRYELTRDKLTLLDALALAGDNCLIMAYAHVAHDCVVGNNVILVNNVSLAGEVEVGDWAILGGHSAVHQFVRIGEHAMASGGSLISKDIPPYVKAAHLPVSFVGSNFIGLRRRNFTTEQIAHIHDIFRIMFQSGLNYTNACDTIEQTLPQSPERDLIVNFVRSSKRGIIKPYNPKKKDEDTE